MKRRTQNLTVPISFRLTKEDSEFLRQHNLSPRGVLMETIKDLRKQLG